MGKLNYKFGICVTNLGNVIADATKQCDQDTLQGQYDKLNQSNVLLCSAFLPDLLLPAKTLRHTTQKENTDIITNVNLVGTTQEKYIKLEKIYS